MHRLPVENVHDYPRPPALEPVACRLVAYLGGDVAADTTEGYRVIETHHAPTYYFPRRDIRAKLESVTGASFCEWKGRARYFDVTCGGKTAHRAAWTYPEPATSFSPIAGYVAFYPGLMDKCFVAHEQVIPQPGTFYGGWVTSNLLGTPKGARGTEHW